MAINYVAAEARLQFYADTIGAPVPPRLLSEDGSPSPELLNFCVRYGASLDWVFLGDLRAMIRDSYRLASMK